MIEQVSLDILNNRVSWDILSKNLKDGKNNSNYSPPQIHQERIEKKSPLPKAHKLPPLTPSIKLASFDHFIYHRSRFRNREKK